MYYIGDELTKKELLRIYFPNVSDEQTENITCTLDEYIKNDILYRCIQRM